MRVLVCGSRQFERPLEASASIVQHIQSLPDDCVVIHGEARGADLWAAQTAERLGLTVVGVPARWKEHSSTCGCSPLREWCWEAGRRRNLEMLDMLNEDDMVLAFWNGHSTGTQHTIENAERLGLFVEKVILK